jgi:hypothetical protein
LAALAFRVDLRYAGISGERMATLLRLSLATVTFLFFFYSTTLLISYFYPLDWTPIVF